MLKDKWEKQRENQLHLHWQSQEREHRNLWKESTYSEEELKKWSDTPTAFPTLQSQATASCLPYQKNN